MSTQTVLSRLQSGLGATRLAPKVTKISVSMALKGKSEGAGARHFVRENLPTIQYNNPSLEFEIIKSADAAMKPLLTVSFGDSIAADQSPKTIELARQQSSAICKQLLDIAAPSSA
ncbi:hypothetical protein INT43_002238 [Umbelopsis isabellina]|uniref:Ribosomal protein/NADH dehydrogenase domain-containing protein n=1 Tax=Mortierella isabellina TaxID=91625 RepID=A0A8H7Q4R9_MORIS|nr:hypothetical protein INT43_002238 [Umbelopsis isabellina]